jgi:methanogenic corrinoid protein MtbC1
LVPIVDALYSLVVIEWEDQNKKEILRVGAELFESYFHAISNADKKKAVEIIDKALEQGTTSEDIIFKMVVPGINKMVESFLYEKKVPLSCHFLATIIASEIVDKLLPFSNKNLEKQVLLF